MAYQFWKMGLLGRDFRYRPFATRLGGGTLWATTSDTSGLAGGAGEVPPFGGAGMTYNVIDTRQSYLQKLLKQALKTMGHTIEAERSVHFAYEMVALSHATARELGYDTSDQADRPFVEVSGRKGLGVKADDLMDRLIDKAQREVEQRHPDLAEDEVRGIAELIAVAALRYFMVKYSRTKVIAFDIEEALSFTGESGPYLQYAVVRANNIFNKLQERLGVSAADVLAALPATPAGPLHEGESGEAMWALVLEAARLDEVVEQSVRTLEPSLLVKYAFGLAQAFNGFYHDYPILNEEREDVRRWRAAVAAYFRRQLTAALELIGSGVPARM
jgi:arginyl-tRNA synthetase